MDPVRKLWSQAKFKTVFAPPKILYAFDRNKERFIVISEDSTIYRIMNARGQVFMVAHFRCATDKDNKYYTCDGPMHIVSCTKYKEDEDQYANDVILPMVFPSK